MERKAMVSAILNRFAAGLVPQQHGKPPRGLANARRV
jgi:hypothetical protein